MLLLLRAYRIVDQAEAIAENRLAFGDKAAKELFTECEQNLLALMRAQAGHKALGDALNTVHTRVSADSSPQDVQAAFDAAHAECSAADANAMEESFEPLTKVRKIMAASNAKASGGAGPSADADDLEDDGFTMTQVRARPTLAPGRTHAHSRTAALLGRNANQPASPYLCLQVARSTKCPLMQVEMTATGELRPMKAPCGHTWSYKAIHDYLGKKKGVAPCPVAGCGKSISISERAAAPHASALHTVRHVDFWFGLRSRGSAVRLSVLVGGLVEDKELIKEIKKAARSRDD